MARLKMCLMIHIEDTQPWVQAVGAGANVAGNAVLLGALASIVGGGTRGAKISLQVDFGYLDQNAATGPYPGGPSSLQGIASFGGNFWCHTHCSAYGHLRSVHACVQSAYGSEIGTNAAGALAATAGRSGGADLNDPTLDWASISVFHGIRKANSATINLYATMAESLRPYGIDFSGAEGQGRRRQDLLGRLEDRRSVAWPASRDERPEAGADGRCTPRLRGRRGGRSASTGRPSGDVFECVPDITLRELCRRYQEERDVRVSPQTMSDTVRRIGFTRKRGFFEARPGSGLKLKPRGRRTLRRSPSSKAD